MKRIIGALSISLAMGCATIGSGMCASHTFEASEKWQIEVTGSCLWQDNPGLFYGYYSRFARLDGELSTYWVGPMDSVTEARRIACIILSDDAEGRGCK